MKRLKFKHTLLTTVSTLLLTAGVTHANAAVLNSPNIPEKAAELPEFKGSVIDKIKNKNKLVIGYRESSIPMAFVAEKGALPVGYGIDICNVIAERFKQAYNLPNLTIEYQMVDGASRVPLVKSGNVDMECGSTTNNAGRRKDVDFSLTYMVAGARILVRAPDNISSLNDLANKRVVFSKGTSQEALIKRLNDERKMGITIIEAPNFGAAAKMIYENEADAFILDDNLLYGERSKMPNPEQLKVVGEFLALEPLAIMVNKSDKSFKSFIDRQIVEMAKSGFLEKNYDKWFQSPIPPNNISLALPPSPLFKEIVRMPTDMTGN